MTPTSYFIQTYIYEIKFELKTQLKIFYMLYNFDLKDRKHTKKNHKRCKVKL